jgi:hypothetical protein
VEERREYIRKSLHSTVSVFERETHQCIGLLADYSPGGFMVASSIRPIEVGRRCEYMLLIQSPVDGNTTRAPFDAECAWCEQTSPSFYGIGFRLYFISPEVREMLESCVD